MQQPDVLRHYRCLNPSSWSIHQCGQIYFLKRWKRELPGNLDSQAIPLIHWDVSHFAHGSCLQILGIIYFFVCLFVLRLSIHTEARFTVLDGNYLMFWYHVDSFFVATLMHNIKDPIHLGDARALSDSEKLICCSRLNTCDETSTTHSYYGLLWRDLTSISEASHELWE